MADYPPPSSVDIIDEDFEEAAKYYASLALGTDYTSTLVELKRRYNEEEDLDSLVWILARHRTRFSHSPSQI